MPRASVFGRDVSLEPLTLPDVDALGLVRIAAATGFPLVSLVLTTPVPALVADACVQDRGRRDEVRRALAATGVRVSSIECFNLVPDADLAAFTAGLDCGAGFGARTATAIVWENADRGGVLRTLRWLCDAAAERGIGVNLEFFASSASLPDLDTAVALAQDARRDTVRLMLDLLHVVRTGTTMERLRRLPADLVGGAQISDGLLRARPADLLAEAGGDRMVPGEGEFPVREFAGIVPVGVVVGVEVPRVAEIGTVPPESRAGRLAAAVHDILR